MQGVKGGPFGVWAMANYDYGRVTHGLLQVLSQSHLFSKDTLVYRMSR